MKFFKHFTDSHRGKLINHLFEEMGHMGPSCYWTLVELCADKLEKRDDEEFTASHCSFVFHESELRKRLRVSTKNLHRFLRICSEISEKTWEISEKSSTISGFFSEVSGKFIKIDMPKLLECLDRDSKRARQERAMAAPKIKNKNKEIESAYLNWRKEATKVYVALKKYPRWGESESEVRADLGDTVFQLARKDAHRMRSLKDDEWTVNIIAGWLKEASQQRQLLLVNCQSQITELSR